MAKIKIEKKGANILIKSSSPISKKDVEKAGKKYIEDEFAKMLKKSKIPFKKR